MSLIQWTRYWQAGQLTSLPEDFEQNYVGEIAYFWRSQFDSLSEGASILDVCTGNGAIALLAMEYSNSNKCNYQVTAVDGAYVDVGSLKLNNSSIEKVVDQISFITEQPIESMATQQQYDLITSQYGIEYCDWEKSSTVIYSHLKQGGKFSIITHAPNTDITRYMKNEKELYDQIRQAKFFDNIEGLINELINLAQFKKKLKSTDRKIKAITQQSDPLVQGIRQYIGYMLAADYDTYCNSKPMIEKYYWDHLSAYQRLMDILHVTDRLSDNPEWYQTFCDVGLELASQNQILQEGRHLAGISYEFIKH